MLVLPVATFKQTPGSHACLFKRPVQLLKCLPYSHQYRIEDSILHADFQLCMADSIVGCTDANSNYSLKIGGSLILQTSHLRRECLIQMACQTENSTSPLAVEHRLMLKATTRSVLLRQT